MLTRSCSVKPVWIGNAIWCFETEFIRVDVSYLREGKKKKKEEEEEEKGTILVFLPNHSCGMGPCLDSSQYHLSISSPRKVQVEGGGHKISIHSESSFLTPVS